MRCTNSLFGSFKVLGNCVKQLSSWAALNSIRMVARAFVKVLWPIPIYVYSVNRAVSCRWEMCAYLCSTTVFLPSFRFVSFAILNAVRSLFAFCWEAFFLVDWFISRFISAHESDGWMIWAVHGKPVCFDVRACIVCCWGFHHCMSGPNVLCFFISLPSPLLFSVFVFSQLNYRAQCPNTQRYMHKDTHQMCVSGCFALQL